MNLYFEPFCSAGVQCFSELGFDFLLLRNNAWQKKKLEEKTIDSYSSYILLFGFYTQQHLAANVVFTLKIGLPRVVPVLRWVSIFLQQIFVSSHSEFEQHM